MSGLRFYFTAAALALPCQSTVAAVEYSVTDLGHLGAGESWAEDVNSSGVVTGRSRAQVGSYLVLHGFWYDTEIHDLGTLYPADSSTSWAKGINDAKQIVGSTDYDDNGTKRARAFRWTDVNDNNAVDSDEMIQLGTLGGFTSSAWDVNSTGQVVGTAQANFSLINKPNHAFRWTDLDGDNVADPGEMSDLGTLTGIDSSISNALAINDSGAVVGDGQSLSGGDYHAFYCRDDIGMIDLGTIDEVGGTSRAEDINNSHVVVGNSASPLGGTRAFRWFDANGNDASDLGEMVDLGDLGGPRSTARGINNLGHIVGHSWTTATGDVHAFIYRDEQMTDLNDLTDPSSGWTLVQAMAIGDSGHIVVDGDDGSPGNHVLLLTPLTVDIPGDLNDDGFVGGADLDIVRSFWGQTVTPGNKLHGDPSGDGFVGGDDLDEVRAHWGEGTTPMTDVPEPAVIVLLAAAVMILMVLTWYRQGRWSTRLS